MPGAVRGQRGRLRAGPAGAPGVPEEGDIPRAGLRRCEGRGVGGAEMAAAREGARREKGGGKGGAAPSEP